jgi:hypothetical protein
MGKQSVFSEISGAVILFSILCWKYEGGRKVFGFTKKTRSYGIEKKSIYSTYSPLELHILRLRCCNFFNSSKKIFLVVLQIGKQEIGKAKTYKHPNV